MIELNRILLQLDKAVSCSNSPYIQDKATAVILFDNLIEIQLYKRTEKLFLFDSPTLHGRGRKFNRKTRKETVSNQGKFDKLLKFARDYKIIEEEDFESLKYVRKIRNEVYHKGELNELKLELAIVTYFSFLARTLKTWGSPSFLYSCPSNDPSEQEIDFGQELFQGNTILIDHEKYFSSALDSIFNRLNIKSDLSEQIIKIITKQIRSIRQDIATIKKESASINFYRVFDQFYWYLNPDFFEFDENNRKPKNLDSILIIYAFLRENREYLDDIHDLKERHKEGRKLLRKYRQKCKGKYPHWVNLNKIENRLESLKSKDEGALMQNLQNIEKHLFSLYLDTNEAASDLNGYFNS